MGVGAGLPAIQALRFVSDSPVRPTADEPAPRGGAGSKDALGVGAGLPAIKTLRFVSDSPVRPPADEPAPRGGAGSNDGRGSWLASD